MSQGQSQSLSQFQLSPCTLSDRDSMSDIWVRAFSGTPMHDLYFPPATCSRAAQHAWSCRRVEKEFAQAHPEVHFFKVTDTETGRLAGWARWGYPFSLAPEEKAARDKQKAEEDEENKRTGSSPFPEGSNVEACTWFFGTLDQMREKYIRYEKCYVLYFLGVDPDYQRRGVGSLLIKYCLDLADAAGAKAYLEGTKEGHSLYLKMGWNDVDQLDVDLARWNAGGVPISNWVMVREPQSKIF